VIASLSSILTDHQRVARAAVAFVGAVLIVALAAWSAQATLRMLAPRPTPARVTRAVPPPAPAAASPGAGTTGTIDLPALPEFVPPVTAADASITPAKPFSLAGIAALDRGRALECLTAALYYEAGSESDDGERAVAQVVLNRVRHSAFPATVCGVVYQGSERAGCQFSFACDGSMARAPSRNGWARATRVASAALNGQVFAPVGLATHYHTYAVTPAWNRTLVMTDAVGAHFFHRWKGYWGTAAAFGQRYRGGEPVPGPHAPVIALPIDALGADVAPASRKVVTLPAHVVSGEPIVTAPSEESQVLDRWRDAGKPLQ
jgi:spore germination cell wall hydrolase CwlJ-like protein